MTESLLSLYRNAAFWGSGAGYWRKKPEPWTWRPWFGLPGTLDQGQQRTLLVSDKWQV